MYLNENLLIEANSVQFGKIFRKIDIYNTNKNRLAEGQYTDILFTINEQKAIKEMFRLIQDKILENALGELNEGMWDSIKQGAQNLKDKAQAGIEKLKQLPEKAKKAYEFCEKIINKSVTKVSELIKYFEELLQQLADTVREAIMKLGGFGKSELTEEADAFMQYGDDERQFLSAVNEYVQQKKGDKQMLTESWLDDLESKVSKNKFLEIVLVGKYKGQKLSWWKTLLVSIVGSVVINLGIGFICAGVGIAAPTAAAITSVILLIWSMRGVLKVILNRKSQMKQTGETKFWNKATIIQLVIIVGVLSFFQIPAVKEWMGEMINAGINKSADWVKDRFDSLMELVGKNPTTEQVSAILEDNGANMALSAQTVSEETSKSIKDQISTWMAGKGATGMAKKAAETLAIDAPGCDVYVINANVNLTNADKVLDSAIEKLGGVVQTAVSENKWGTTYLLNVVVPEGTDLGDLPAETIQALKDAGADSTAFIKLDNIGEVIPVPEPEIVAQVSEDILNPGAYFGGIAAMPEFEGLKGEMKLSLGSEARQNQYVIVTDFKDMTFEQAQNALKDLGENANKLGFKRLKNQDEASKGFTAKLSMISDSKLEEAEGDKDDANSVLKDAIDTNADPKNDKCLVFFTNVKSDGKTKQLPLVAINYRTLYAVDLIKSKKLKSRKNPYFVKGLFNHLTIKPIKDGDTDTQLVIKKFLMNFLLKSVSGLAKLCQATIGEAKKDGKKIEWTPKADDNDKERLELGNFTTNEFCDILNNPKDAYKYFGGTYATNITKTDANGNVLSAKNRRVKIEDKEKYIETQILPIVTNKNTDVYKELADNELIKKWYMDKDGNFKTAKDKDGNEVSILTTNAVAPTLYRSMDGFSMDQKRTLVDNIKKLFGNSEQADLKDQAKATQMISLIIWKYKGDRIEWAKQKKQAAKQESNESLKSKTNQKSLLEQVGTNFGKIKSKPAPKIKRLNEDISKLGYSEKYIKMTEEYFKNNL